MKRSVKIVCLVVISCSALVAFISQPRPASAAGLQMAPAEYRANLDGKIKKGTVVISNASGEAQEVTIQIRAFRQTDNKGTLQFYENPLISAGITPDYNQFTLGPSETMHRYFQLNGEALPKKQLFAALLAQAQPVQGNFSITPVLRVGTLLILNNGNQNVPKKGAISGWNVGLFQLGDSIGGSFDFKNTERGDSVSGYFPEFTVGVGSLSDKFTGTLVFPGIVRQQIFNIPGSHLGLFNLKLSSDAGAGASQWVVVVTGYWRWLLPLVVMAGATCLVLIIKLIRKQPRRRHKR